MKKLLIAGVAVTLFACGNSESSDVVLYYMPGCPYCHQAEDFLKAEGIAADKINVTDGPAAMEKFQAALKKCDAKSGGVPLIIVKGKCIQGFDPAVGVQIKGILGK